MSKLTQIKLALSKLLSNFSTEGKLTWTEEGPIEVGYEVYTEDSEGNYIPAEDGEYTLGEKTVKVEGSKVVSIDAPTELSATPEEVALEEEPAAEESAPEEEPAPEVVEEQMSICDSSEPVSPEMKEDETPAVEELAEETPDPLADIRAQVGELADVVAVLVEKVSAIEQEAALTKETLEKMSKMSVAMSAQIEVEKGAVSGTGNPKLDAHLQEMFR